MNTSERARHVGMRITLVGCALNLALLGCYRSSPPAIPEFAPPPEPVEKQAATTEAVEDTAASDVEEPAPEEEPEPMPVEVSAAPPPPPPSEPEPEPETPKGPTIVGTWRCAEMIHSGQSMPMPPGMEMTLTFSEDGALTMSNSAEPQSRQGTYTLDGNQITISMEGETKTGTLTLEGETQATLDIDEVQLVLARV